jgi:hypothetical protein
VGVLKNVPVGVPKIRKIKKVTTSQDDDFVGELAIQLVGYAASTKDLKVHQLSVKGQPMAIFAPMVSKKPDITPAQPRSYLPWLGARVCRRSERRRSRYHPTSAHSTCATKGFAIRRDWNSAGSGKPETA